MSRHALRRWRRPLAVAATVAVLAFGAVTLLALEGREVVELRTTAPDGAVRAARIWVADVDGAMWVEAANPERSFLLDVQERPEVELVRGRTALPLRATPVPGEAGHRKIRQLLRARYGWADVWVGLLTDTSRSVAVRLEPRTP